MTGPLADSLRLVLARENLGDLEAALALLGVRLRGDHDVTFTEEAISPPPLVDAPWPDDESDDDWGGDYSSDLISELTSGDPSAIGSAAPEGSAGSWPSGSGGPGSGRPGPGGATPGPHPAPPARHGQGGRPERVVCSVIEPTSVTPIPVIPDREPFPLADRFTDEPTDPAVDLGTLAARLYSLTKAPRRGTELDVEAVIGRTVRGLPVEHLPVRMIPSAPERVEVLVEQRLRIGPYAEDIRLLVEGLRSVLGTSKVREWGFVDEHGLRCGRGPIWTWRPLQHVLTEGVLLFVTDGRSGGGPDGRSVVDQVTRSLAHAGRPVAVLALGSRAPRSSTAPTWWIDDDRPEPVPDATALRVEQVRRELRLAGLPDTDVGVLAAHLSVPPRVGWSFLRTTRRRLTGPGTLSLELDLVDRGPVDGLTQGGFTLDADFVREARRILRAVYADAPPELVAALRPEPGHQTPLLDVETELCWAFVADADPAPRCASALRDVFLSLPDESRHGIRGWAGGAVGRLPEEVLQTPAGYLLRRVANVRPSGPTTVDWSGFDRAVLQQLAHALAHRTVAFSRTPEGLTLDIPRRRHLTAIRIPALAGLGLSATWVEDGSPRSVDVPLSQLPVTIPCGRSEIALVDVAGVRYVLPAYEEGPPEEARVRASIERLARAWSDDEALEVQIVRETSTGAGYVVRFVAAPACTGFVPRVSADTVWQHGSARLVRLVRADPERRMYLVAPVDTTQLDVVALFEVGQSIEGVVESIVNFGGFIRLPQGAVGLLHNSEWPATESLTVGDRLTVVVLSIDSERNRISVRPSRPRGPAVWPRRGVFRSPADAQEYQARTAGYVVGRVVAAARVSAWAATGLCVQLDDAGVDGFLSNAEIPADSDLGVDDRCAVQVVERTEDGRILLGLVPRPPADVRRRRNDPGLTRQDQGPAVGASWSVRDPETRARVAELIDQVVRAGQGPVRLTQIGDRLREALPRSIWTSRWFGSVNMTAFLSEELPGVRLTPDGDGAQILAPGADDPATVRTAQPSTPRTDSQARTRARIAELVRQVVPATAEPVPLTVVGNRLRALLPPEVWADRWFGSEKLSAFLREELPDLRFLPGGKVQRPPR